MTEKTKILIADSAKANREELKSVLEKQFYVLEAADGREAIHIIEAGKEEIAIVFLNPVMPVQDGLEVLKFMNEKHYMDFMPVIMIADTSNLDYSERAYEYGVSDVISRPFFQNVVIRRVMNIIELFHNREYMEEELKTRTKQLQRSQERMNKSNGFLINALSSVIEFRSLETKNHVRRVGYFTRALLKYLRHVYPEYQLSDENVDNIVWASALHDVGKIAIPDKILLKPGKLLPYEFDEMKKHTVYGCEILKKFAQEEDELYRYCYDICRYHHEKWDGSGYPDHLAGDTIPIWAQVVAVADCYDALVSQRVYKDAFTPSVAAEMIKNGECGEFSPKILNCFGMAEQDFLDIARNF